jgi:hypothetical protein
MVQQQSELLDQLKALKVVGGVVHRHSDDFVVAPIDVQQFEFHGSLTSLR